MMHDKPLKDRQGRPLTIGLFKETAQPSNKMEPPFSLAEWKTVYMESNDPTEYLPAMALTGDWLHWQAVRNHRQLKNIFDSWAIELEMKLKSEAVRTMIAQSMQPGGTAAAKWLAEKGYLQDVTNKKSVGRPKAEEKEANIPSTVANKLENVLHLVANRK
jgi:hypothetical protein